MQFVTPTRRRCALNYYITQCTGNSISWGIRRFALGKVDKRKEKISKISNETPLKRKFVFVAINHIRIKLQLDTGSNITIINEKTWKILGKPSLLTRGKVARGISGKKLNFLDEFTYNISYVGKTKKQWYLC